MTRFEKRVREAFCKGCRCYDVNEPECCDAFYRESPPEENCVVLTGSRWLARGARWFVRMEEADRLKRQQRIDAEIKREEELLKTMNRTHVLIGYPVRVIWGAHGRRYHELGGQPPWPVAACGTGFYEPHWGTPAEAKAKGLTSCRLICGHVIHGVDEGRYPAEKREQGDADRS